MKKIISWNDVFADIVNVLLFKGKRLMKEKDLEAVTGDNYFETVYNNNDLKNKKGCVTMCSIFEDFVNEGKAEGRAEGREEGKAELVRKMLDAKLVSEQQIADLLKISVKEVKKIAAKVPVEA